MILTDGTENIDALPVVSCSEWPSIFFNHQKKKIDGHRRFTQTINKVHEKLCQVNVRAEFLEGKREISTSVYGIIKYSKSLKNKKVGGTMIPYSLSMVSGQPELSTPDC